MKKLLTLLSSVTFAFAASTVEPGTLNVAVVTPQKVDTVPIGTFLGTYAYPLKAHYTISANTDSFIVDLAVKPFEHVQKAQRLLTLKSPKLLDLQSTYINTLLELEYYDKEVRRLAPLAQKGVVATKKLIESRNRLQKLEASAAFMRDVLHAYGMQDSKVASIAKAHKPDPILFITAPASGNIASLEVQQGSYVTQGQRLATLIDTDECHFEIDMPWQLADTLASGEQLYAQGHRFTLYARAPQIDSVSQTRSIDLHEEGHCGGKGGMSLNITLFRSVKAWKVPASAVVKLKGNEVLFVQQKHGFVPLPVKVLARFGGFCYVHGELNASQPIATSSVIALRNAAGGE